jgi:UDP-2,4-diacetamido-2,4,6-trideoxy-beta-L-altropyranose hydrolase
MTVLVRTDASHEIGSGHVMRCLTLARALRNRGAECHFVCRDHPGNLIELIRSNGFRTTALPRTENALAVNAADHGPLRHHAWLGTDWKTDAQQTMEALKIPTVEWLIVDHYSLGWEWETMMRQMASKTLVIDDLADRRHDCDLLLDQNLPSESNHPYQDLLPHDGVPLLGPHYALLQPEYAELQPRTQPRSGPVRRLLIYFGGADRNNLTGMTLAVVLATTHSDLTIDVVINPEGPHADSIRELARGNPRILLHERIPSLAGLMAQADLSIGASGTTSWERCCLGLPSLVITLSENQRPIAASLSERGAMRWLGHWDEVTQEHLSTAIANAVREPALAVWSNRCRSLVDGKGTERVAELLFLNSKTQLKARLACAKDESLILRLANDPLVRFNSFQPEIINEATHHRWFKSRLQDPENHRIYLIETVSGLVTGQVRFDQKDDGWEISFMVATEARSKGLGTQMLSSALEAFCNSEPNPIIFGRVKHENLRSQALFKKLGFVGTQSSEHILYRRKFLS